MENLVNKEIYDFNNKFCLRTNAAVLSNMQENV
jgi:hypothetical protein